MARYSNIMIGGMSSCYMNGRQISVIDGEVYVDGVHYVPADGEHVTKDDPFTPGKMVEHTFEVSNDYDSIMSKGFFDVVFKQVDKQGNRIKILGDKQRWRCVNDDRCREIL